jgi:hypothetical protein
MRNLTGLLFVALLLFSLPAQACGLVMRETADGELSASGVDVHNVRHCSVPPSLLTTVSLLSLRRLERTNTSLDSPDASSVRRWRPSSEYRWEPDVSRAMEQAFMPPSGTSLVVTQTREDVRDGSKLDYKPNSTLGTIEFRIHW